MTTTNVSLEQLQRVHQALRITIPLHQVSPMMLSTLKAIVHCWRDRIPANLWDAPNDKSVGMTPQEFQRQYTVTFPVAADNKPQSIDLKRRAAADYE